MVVPDTLDSSFVRDSLDHLVGAREQRRRNFKAERLRSGQVNDEIELGRLLNRDVVRLRSAQNLVYKFGGASVEVLEVSSIGHQPSRLDILASDEHGRQPRGRCQSADANPVGGCEWIVADVKGLHA